MFKINFKNKVRFYVALGLGIAGVIILIYTSFLNVDDRTNVDKFYGSEATRIVKELKNTKWGKSSRGRKILAAYREKEIRIITPKKIKHNENVYYSYEDDVLLGPAEGMMAIEQGVFRIYISVYNKNDGSLKEGVKTIDFMEFRIPEDEFIHILVDELLSRHQRGFFFVDGEASWQEEIDAWEAAEESVQAYYNDENYVVYGFSQMPPNYGPDNDFYMRVR
jgi:hypothetical protein